MQRHFSPCSIGKNAVSAGLNMSTTSRRNTLFAVFGYQEEGNRQGQSAQCLRVNCKSSSASTFPCSGVNYNPSSIAPTARNAEQWIPSRPAKADAPLKRIKLDRLPRIPIPVHGKPFLSSPGSDFPADVHQALVLAILFEITVSQR